MGFVIVEFVEPREVRVNGESQGQNMDDAGHYRILRVADGIQTFSLGPPADYVPEEQAVVVGGTSLIEPLRVTFQRKS